MGRVMKPRPRRPQPAKMETPKERFRVIEWCQAELREMKRIGNWDGDPKMWHPVRKLVQILEDPTSTKAEMLKAADILLPYIETPMAAQLKLDAGGHLSDTNVVISVQPWAAAKRPALPAPKEDDGDPNDPSIFDA